MKKKYKTIFKHEEKVSWTLAESLFKPKEMEFGFKVLVPILFFVDYAMIKMNLKRTQANLFFTKKLALEAVKNMSEGGNRNEEREKIVTGTNKLLKTDKKEVYSQQVREAQLSEIDILISHYLKLLDSEGKEYGDLAKAAYSSKKEYNSFLKALEKAEKNVNNTAITDLKVESKKDLRAWFSRLEKNTSRIRKEETEEIFSGE
ncbi:MAG: NF038143 family protein [Candidatus Hydrothermarchaeaceae archaeon]